MMYEFSIQRSTVTRKDGKQAYICNYVPQTDGDFRVSLKFIQTFSCSANQKNSCNNRLPKLFLADIPKIQMIETHEAFAAYDSRRLQLPTQSYVASQRLFPNSFIQVYVDMNEYDISRTEQSAALNCNLSSSYEEKTGEACCTQMPHPLIRYVLDWCIRIIHHSTDKQLGKRQGIKQVNMHFRSCFCQAATYVSTVISIMCDKLSVKSFTKYEKYQ